MRPLKLDGLNEADAEALLRSCNVRGTSADIRYYLTTYCGNHPLVTGVAVAKFHLGQLTGDDAQAEAERLAQLRRPAHRTLAMLWLALGDRAQAEKHALAASEWAWADGEPYVNRYELTKTTELLEEMKVAVPKLPPYDPTKDEPFPWEAEVRAAIETIRAEKEAEAKKREMKSDGEKSD